MNYPQLVLPDTVLPPTASGVSWTPRSPARSSVGSRSSSVAPGSRSSSLAPTPRGAVTARAYERSRSRGLSMSPRYSASLPADDSQTAKVTADPRAAMRRMMQRNSMVNPKREQMVSTDESPTKLSKAQRRELRNRSTSMVAQLATLEAKRDTLRKKVDTEEITLDDLDDGDIGQTLQEFAELDAIVPTLNIDAELAATKVEATPLLSPKGSFLGSSVGPSLCLTVCAQNRHQKSWTRSLRPTRAMLMWLRLVPRLLRTSWRWPTTSTLTGSTTMSRTCLHHKTLFNLSFLLHRTILQTFYHARILRLSQPRGAHFHVNSILRIRSCSQFASARAHKGGKPANHTPGDHLALSAIESDAAFQKVSWN